MQNLYRQPRPTRSEVVAKGRSYAADENGRRTSSYGRPLLLSRSYIWVDESLSIPLESIIDLGSTKRGGFIRFEDRLDDTIREIDFTFAGFFGPRLKKIASFLAAVDEQRRIRVQELQASDQLDPVVPSCELCDDRTAGVYVFPDPQVCWGRAVRVLLLAGSGAIPAVPFARSAAGVQSQLQDSGLGIPRFSWIHRRAVLCGPEPSRASSQPRIECECDGSFGVRRNRGAAGSRCGSIRSGGLLGVGSVTTWP